MEDDHLGVALLPLKSSRGFHSSGISCGSLATFNAQKCTSIIVEGDRCWQRYSLLSGDGRRHDADFLYKCSLRGCHPTFGGRELPAVLAAASLDWLQWDGAMHVYNRALLAAC